MTPNDTSQLMIHLTDEKCYQPTCSVKQAPNRNKAFLPSTVLFTFCSGLLIDQPHDFHCVLVTISDTHNNHKHMLKG